MLNLDTVTVASFIAVAALGLTRLLTTAKPLWDLLPPALQGIIPALVLVLPQIAEKAAGVHTGLDLANLLVLAGALIVPGVHSHTVALVKPSGPSSGAAVGLVFAFALSVTACSRLAAVDWPKQLEVCAAPAESVLLVEVSDILAGTEDVETALLGLVKSGATKEAVWCAVNQLAADVGFNPSTARAARISARGKAFLDKVASR